jgi:small subunit ribosomal protein S16
MVRIRFRRVGARNQASFRIVAADKESPRDGRYLEVLGMYNPRTSPSTVKVDEARLFHWMSNGAQPSDSVTQTLQSLGTWERWERFKGGESLETLIPEAEAATPEVDPRTRRDDQIGQRSTKRRRHPDAESSPDEPKAEAEAEDAEPEAAAEEAAPETEAPEAAEGEAEAEEAVPAADEAEAEEAEEAAPAADEAEAEEAEPAVDEAEAEEAEPAADEADDGESE